ncbi:hypothetical protein [Streptomyces sp. NPDC003863]
MDEILVRTVGWIARGAGIVIDLLSFGDFGAVQHGSRTARKPRR